MSHYTVASFTALFLVCFVIIRNQVVRKQRKSYSCQRFYYPQFFEGIILSSLGGQSYLVKVMDRELIGQYSPKYYQAGHNIIGNTVLVQISIFDIKNVFLYPESIMPPNDIAEHQNQLFHKKVNLSKQRIRLFILSVLNSCCEKKKIKLNHKTHFTHELNLNKSNINALILLSQRHFNKSINLSESSPITNVDLLSKIVIAAPQL